MSQIDKYIEEFTSPSWFGDKAELVISVEENFSYHDKCIINLAKKYVGDEPPQFPFFTVMYYNGVLTLSGGFGTGVFNWYNSKNSVGWMANLRSEGYIIEKCQASSANLGEYKHFSAYDSDLAEKEYKEFQKEYRRDLEEGDFRWDLKFPKLDFDTYDSMKNSVFNVLYEYLSEVDEFYDTLDLEEFGVKISPNFQKMWAWFNVAVDMANEKGLLNGYFKSKKED